ncbi:MAG: DUF1289 domain-containing protein [Pseudoalteromonas spongiae]|uniref:DUF1289 domain-containing protein n=1 Tax=Pseudoalteromonas spongiae TaxID=298657 RepID=A0ABU8ENH6_9GAMM|nr:MULTISPECIES: DUF1289 domain-containing protein [Pseudoalteromonas]KPV96605.1 hypothetical protein AN214_01431 [Pseudoalteromonas sp. P1-9]MCF6457589.1 DUF1289 domain-containing protein [Pseudoalteromonas sp. MMG024]TMO87608.1 DUF1289 domain-containing protein [Pseudoalteromonas spongiae]
MSQQTVKSPCVENCCLNEDDVCLGCFRTLEEILSWSSMSLSQKRTTLNLCQQRKQQKQHAKKDFNSR